MKHVDIAIIGAGTAGLTARNAVAKHCDNYVVIDPGPLGTLCARAGCMPSKALINTANRIYDFRRPPPGLPSGDPVQIDSAEVLRHVRALRDRFVAGALRDMERWKDQHLIQGRAKFIDPQTLEVEGERLHARSVIVATGSRPVIPNDWRQFGNRLVTSDSLFELDKLPDRMAVIGLGPLGIELAQALHRLGVDVTAIDPSRNIGGLTDPELQNYAVDHFARELTVFLEQAHIDWAEDRTLAVKAGDQTSHVESALIAVGREPVIDGLGLENLGVELDGKGLPAVDATTLRVGDLPVFMAGDVNGIRPIQHEAANEGRIAGHSALQESTHGFDRLTRLTITFCSPNIATVGHTFQDLQVDDIDFVTGSANFEHQGRARIMDVNSGLLHVYAKKRGGHILGAELFAPGGEHLAHLIAWAIAQGNTVHELLKMPYYHPVLEEGLRTAIKNAAREVTI